MGEASEAAARLPAVREHYLALARRVRDGDEGARPDYARRRRELEKLDAARLGAKIPELEAALRDVAVLGDLLPAILACHEPQLHAYERCLPAASTLQEVATNSVWKLWDDLRITTQRPGPGPRAAHTVSGPRLQPCERFPAGAFPVQAKDAAGGARGCIVCPEQVAWVLQEKGSRLQPAPL